MGIGLVNYVMIAVQILITAYIVMEGTRSKRVLAPAMSVIQTAALALFFILEGQRAGFHSILCVDRFSIIMLVITAVAGGLTAVYAAGKSRKSVAAILVTMVMMACLVIFNNLLWVFICWEIIGLIGFRMISGSDDGKTSTAFRMLNMDLFGGMGFVAGIIILGHVFGTVEISTMILAGTVYGDLVAVTAVFLAFAVIVRTAQMPFSRWLTETAEMPAATVAMLSTFGMVNSGAFMILKIAPLLGNGNFAGLMAMTVGAAVFLAAALAAVSQKDAGRLLAYSTVSVMGLVIVCGGIGTAESVWAGVMIILFHSIAKVLLIMCTGTAAAYGGSSDMDVINEVYAKMPKLAVFTVAGIAAMFMAPFGMLIAQWAALTASVDSGNIIVVAAVCFGTAVTAVYWIRWMAKIVSVRKAEETCWDEVKKEERLAELVLVILIAVMCLTFPLFSMYMLVPYLEIVFGGLSAMLMTADNMIILVAMIAVVVLLTGVFFGKGSKKEVPVYLGGIRKEVSGSVSGNIYIDNWFSEKRMLIAGGTVSAAMIIIGIGFMAGTLINLLGGVA